MSPRDNSINPNGIRCAQRVLTGGTNKSRVNRCNHFCSKQPGKQNCAPCILRLRNRFDNRCHMRPSEAQAESSQENSSRHCRRAASHFFCSESIFGDVYIVVCEVKTSDTRNP
jgi:hypothetical protein